MKRVFLFLTLLSCLIKARSQGGEFKLQNYRPASPTAFQFLKYTDLPVSEYTGIPNITVPLYQIDEDGVSVPIHLTYHSGGIRVSQEASSVGLGWDLQFGSIVQEINDRDDYESGITHTLPDYHYGAVPTDFTTKYTYACVQTINGGWSSPVSVPTPDPYHSYMVPTAYYMPINGDFDNQSLGQNICTNPNYDSEPDIFRASFLGHSITFLKPFGSSSLVVLNKKGYVVTHTDSTFKIVVPTGDEFYFEVNNAVLSNSQTTGGLGGSSSSDELPGTRIWMLTKIITRNKRQVAFTYAQTDTVLNYPNYSERWDTATAGSPSNHTACYSVDHLYGYLSLPIGDTAKTFSYSRERRRYISSITFPNGEINFYSSDRDDLLGGKKIDSFIVTSSSRTIKSYRFYYSYFDASAVGGNLYQPPSPSAYGDTYKYRLRLDSVADKSGAVHSFTYNSIPLPAKNSFAQDFWGYYNGKLTNTSLVPNPTRLKLAYLGHNSNNNAAKSDSCQAGMLMEIKYPTGGKTTFEYELNQFDNYWVPDFTDTTNTTSTGNGLRIHAIKYFATGSTLTKKTVYSYSGGKGIVPLSMLREYSFNQLQAVSSDIMTKTNYQVKELNGKGFFSTNSLGSINGVGYDVVTRQEVDSNNLAIGKTVTFFYNEPDVISISANSSSQLSAALPAIKKLGVPENGSVKTIMYYDSLNTVLRKTMNSYYTINSDLYYAARVFSYTSLYYGIAGSGWTAWTSVPQNLIGYYPIYDIESQHTTDSTIVYANGDSLNERTITYFDNAGQISERLITTSNSLEQIQYGRCYDDLGSGQNNALYLSNRLADVVTMHRYRRDLDYGNSRLLSQYENEYAVTNGQIVVSQSTLDDHPSSNPIPTVITYDLYDSSANLTQYTKAGEVNSMVWDYNKKYLTADVKNSSQATMAYTSFEAENKGNWTYSGGTNSTYSMTGGRSYNMSGGNITRSLSTAAYVVSYWGRSGSVNVNGSGPTRTGKTIGDWTYYEHDVTTNSITVSGSNYIDELRLYPKTAQMTTYTYLPLVGITSQSDPAGHIIFYEYDSFNRLKLVKDEDGRILKRMDYKYQGGYQD